MPAFAQQTFIPWAYPILSALRPVPSSLEAVSRSSLTPHQNSSPARPFGQLPRYDFMAVTNRDVLSSHTYFHTDSLKPVVPTLGTELCAFLFMTRYFCQSTMIYCIGEINDRRDPSIRCASKIYSSLTQIAHLFTASVLSTRRPERP